MSGKQGQRKLKCSVCERYVDRELITKISGKNYCEDCKGEVLKKAEDYKKLCTYIYETIYDKDCNMPLITTQLKKLKTDYEDFTDRGMLTTLKYAFELEQIPKENLDPDWGVYNIIIRYYRKAKQFWIKKLELEKNLNEIEEALTLPPNEIIIKRSSINRKDEEDREKQRKLEHRQILTDETIIDDDSLDLNLLKDLRERKRSIKEDNGIDLDKIKKFRTQ